MNALVSKEGPQPEPKAASYAGLIRSRLESSTKGWAGRLRDEIVPDQGPAPVFHVGFPRAGTTLRDTMLMGHPGIEVLEEERTLLATFDILADYDAIPT